MWPEFLKNFDACPHDCEGKCPVVKCLNGLFPKSYMVYDGISITLNNVGCRIKLYDPLIFFRDSRDVPKDGCEPKTECDDQANEFGNIGDEQVSGGG